MEVMRLEFIPEIKERLLEKLNCFSSEELKITFEDSLFEKDKKRLQASDDKINNGTAKFYTLEELDEILDQEFPLE